MDLEKICLTSNHYIIVYEIARIEFQNKLKSARTHQEEKSAKNALNQFSICFQIIDSPALQLLRIRALM